MEMIQGSPGVYFCPAEHGKTLKNYAPFVEMFRDGVLWRVILVIESRGPESPGIAVPKKKGTQWVNPDANNVHILSYLVQGHGVQSMDGKSDWMFLDPWKAEEEMHPLHNIATARDPKVLKALALAGGGESPVLPATPLPIPQHVWEFDADPSAEVQEVNTAELREVVRVTQEEEQEEGAPAGPDDSVLAEAIASVVAEAEARAQQERIAA